MFMVPLGRGAFTSQSTLSFPVKFHWIEPNHTKSISLCFSIRSNGNSEAALKLYKKEEWSSVLCTVHAEHNYLKTSV